MIRFSELVAQRVPAERMKWYFRCTCLCYVRTKNRCTCLSFPNPRILWVPDRLAHRSLQVELQAGRVQGQQHLVPHERRCCQIVVISVPNQQESRPLGNLQMSLNS